MVTIVHLWFEDSGNVSTSFILEKLNDSKRDGAADANDKIDPHPAVSLWSRLHEHCRAIDFTGTTKELYGNLNAPRAVTFSAIIYVLRSLVN